MVTDAWIAKQRGGKPPSDTWWTCKVIVERLVNSWPSKRRNALTAASKWRAVDLLAAGRDDEAVLVLL